MTLWRVMWHVTHVTHMTIFVTLSHSHKLRSQLGPHLATSAPQTADSGAAEQFLQILTFCRRWFKEAPSASTIRCKNSFSGVLWGMPPGLLGWAGLGWAEWKSADYIHWSLLIHKAEVNKEPTKQIFINLLLHITYPHTHCCYIIQFTGM